MPKVQETMSQDEITEVFKTLRLPTEQSAVPPVQVQPDPGPVMFFTIDGTSPPLQTR